jgi:glyoxylase-like metal-dependent hydrolase (beta-lactamase superfamily II)
MTRAVPSAVMTEPGFPETGSARIHVLHEGYVREAREGNRVASTVVLIIDGLRVIVVDPGMVADRAALIAALTAAGPGPGDVTDVVFSHHHPDHTVNAALFPSADVHDHWASYRDDLWMDREPGDLALTGSVCLVATPGHTNEDITTLAATPGGVYACTHAWWGPDGPAVDPLGADQAALERSRERILAVATVIVPGHGPAFQPGPDTPR